MQNLEASISLCDPMNPGFGYQIRIVRAAQPGDPVDVLFTSRDPVTGKNLLTYEQCLDVLAICRNAPRTDSANKEHAMTKKSTGPLFVGKNERGEPFLYDNTPTDLDLNDLIALDDVLLWDAYVSACRAQQGAAQNVLSNLRKPTRTEVEIRVLPTPTSDEIRALACLHVTERLRSRRKINMAFSALAGVSEARVESAWALDEPITELAPPEMVKALHSKGWISNVGSGCYVLTCSGEEQLNTAVAVALPTQVPVPA